MLNNDKTIKNDLSAIRYLHDGKVVAEMSLKKSSVSETPSSSISTDQLGDVPSGNKASIMDGLERIKIGDK